MKKILVLTLMSCWWLPLAGASSSSRSLPEKSGATGTEAFGPSRESLTLKQHLTPEPLSSFLNRFYANPKEVMDEPIPKFNEENKRVFPALKQNSEDLFEHKGQARDFIMKKSKFYSRSHGANESLIEENDQVQAFIDNPEKVVRNINEFDRLGLTRYFLPKLPWSGDYWATRKGLIARRYGDPLYPKNGDWDIFHQYRTRAPLSAYLNPQKINLLSPAEKYDLLIGSPGLFTDFMWEQGKVEFDKHKTVEPWYGICHGWAAASIMLDSPKSAIALKSFDGDHNITFYPTDIKALGSMIWAQGVFETRFIGTRCNLKNPARDANGRVSAKECFDTNPGTWHMAVLNQLGRNHRSFLMDTTYDYEIWNQPIVGFDVVYFNPQTSATSLRAQDVAIPIEEFNRDLFKSFRNPEAKRIVGAEMTIQYTSESDAVQRLYEHEVIPPVIKIAYRYDLELDADGNILGGEWYSNKHPDFLWTPVLNGLAKTEFDGEAVGRWKAERRSLPEEWKEAAHKAAKLGQPLGPIVTTMFEMSQKAAPRTRTPVPNDPRIPTDTLGPEAQRFLAYCNSNDTAVRQTIAAMMRETRTTDCAQTYRVMKGISSLEISSLLRGRKISNLWPLAEFPNLRALKLKNNLIFDLSPLQHLPNLVELNLSDNQIRNITPLAYLRNLRNLDLSENQIVDISPLAYVGGLVDLDLSENEIQSLAPLQRHAGLYRLKVKDNPIIRGERTCPTLTNSSALREVCR